MLMYKERLKFVGACVSSFGFLVWVTSGSAQSGDIISEPGVPNITLLESVPKPEPGSEPELMLALPEVLQNSFDPLEGRDVGSDNAEWGDISEFGRGLTPTQAGTTRVIRAWSEASGNKGIGRKTDFEGDEVWTSFCVKLGSDWNPSSNMKMPGFGAHNTGGASTAADFASAIGGQGGGGAGGQKSWSARMQVTRPEHRVPGALGFEMYHRDSTNHNGGRTYGEPMWMGNSLDESGPRLEGSIGDFNWHCVKQHAKLNTKSKSDGVIEAWLDGELRFRRDDLNLSDNDKYRNISFWLELYHGGSRDTTGTEHSVFFTDFTYSLGSEDNTTCGC